MARKLISFKIRKAILERDNYRCAICGNTNRHSKLEVDHIIPIVRGGTNDFDNLCILCEECNRGKCDDLIRIPIVKNKLQQELDKDELEKKRQKLEQLRKPKSIEETKGGMTPEEIAKKYPKETIELAIRIKKKYGENFDTNEFKLKLKDYQYEKTLEILGHRVMSKEMKEFENILDILEQKETGIDKLKCEAENEAYKELEEEYPTKIKELKEHKIKGDIKFIQKNWDKLTKSEVAILKTIGINKAGENTRIATQSAPAGVGELSFSDSAKAPSKPPQSITKKEAVASEN